MPVRLVRPGRTSWCEHPRQPAARRGLCALHQHAEPSHQQLQCVPGRRDDDDGQGAIHRDVRRSALHHQHGRIRRRVHQSASGRPDAGPDRRRQHQGDVSRRAVDRPGRPRCPAADALLFGDQSDRLHRGAAGRRQRLCRPEGLSRRGQPGTADRSGPQPRRSDRLSVGALERGGARVDALSPGIEPKGRQANCLRCRAQRLRRRSGDRLRAAPVRQRGRPVPA